MNALRIPHRLAIADAHRTQASEELRRVTDNHCNDDWDPEEAGADLISRVLGGTPRRHDHNDGEPKHDFDICMPGRSEIALEVTQHLVQEREDQRGAIEALSWAFEVLDRDWFIDLTDSVQIRTLHSELPSSLSWLEQAGISDLIVRPVADDADEDAQGRIVKKLRCLGVRSCRSYSHESVGKVHIDQAVDPAWGSEDSPAAAVRHHTVERADNTRKLGLATSAAERHLLIWVDHAALGINAAMQYGERHGRLPKDVPELPDEVDTVWLALAVSVERPIVWRLDNAGWTSRGRCGTSE